MRKTCWKKAAKDENSSAVYLHCTRRLSWWEKLAGKKLQRWKVLQQFIFIAQGDFPDEKNVQEKSCRGGKFFNNSSSLHKETFLMKKKRWKKAAEEENSSTIYLYCTRRLSWWEKPAGKKLQSRKLSRCENQEREKLQRRKTLQRFVFMRISSTRLGNLSGCLSQGTPVLTRFRLESYKTLFGIADGLLPWTYSGEAHME